MADTLGLDEIGDNDNEAVMTTTAVVAGSGGRNGADGGDARNPGCRGNVRGQTEPQ